MTCSPVAAAVEKAQVAEIAPAEVLAYVEVLVNLATEALGVGEAGIPSAAAAATKAKVANTTKEVLGKAARKRMRVCTILAAWETFWPASELYPSPCSRALSASFPAPSTASRSPCIYP